VTPVVRSFFLNELDGLAANHGILTIATTNHPERIDDAIVNRPSRFDVKYTYNLPTKALRKLFADKWITKINNFKQDNAATPTVVFAISDEEISDRVAEECEEFSFAFLKELRVFFTFHSAASSLVTPALSPSSSPSRTHILAVRHRKRRKRCCSSRLTRSKSRWFRPRRMATAGAAQSLL
jgi:hypothetical protein